MEKAAGGISTADLDRRLLRFRSQPGSEEGRALASALFEVGRDMEALEVASTGLQSDPDDARMLLVSGKALLRQGDLLRAQASLLHAARSAPNDHEPFQVLGEVLLKRGDPGRAAKVLSRALSLAPGDSATARLHDRAMRLARLSGEDPSAGPAIGQPVGKEDLPEEATVVRADLSAQLAASTRGADESDEIDTGAASPGALLGQTKVQALRAGVPVPVPAPAPAPWSPPAPGPRGPKQTMVGLGGPAPLRAPAYPTPEEAFDDEEPTAAVLGPPPGMRRPVGPLQVFAPPSPDFPPRSPAPSREPAWRPPSPARVEVVSAPVYDSAETTLPEGVRAAAGVQIKPEPSPFGDDPFGDDPFSDDPFDDESAPTVAPARRSPDAWDRSPGRQPSPVYPAPADDFPDPYSPAPRDRSLRSEQPPRYPEPDDDFSDPYGPEPGRPHADPDFMAEDGVDFDPQPDATLGEAYGTTENVDRILDMLAREGLFERPTGQGGEWASRKESKGAGTRVGRVLIGVWVLALVLATGGYFGWQAWVAHRHEQARLLVEEAAGQALRGDHADLVAGERSLRIARDFDPHDKLGTEVLLFLQTQRALEEGTFEPAYLRPTLRRAQRLRVHEAQVEAAQAVLAAAEGELDAARAHLDTALTKGRSDGRVLYVVGRLEQRLGDARALEHLASARERESELVAASIAVAEATADDGQREEALRIIGEVLERDPDHLRATLWRAFLSADEADPAAALAQVEQLQPRLDEGAPTDEVLLQLVRSRLARRQGDEGAAAAAVDSAVQGGATDPRLLALVALEAKAVGRLALAQAAATNAVAGAPTNTDFRKLLAEILIDRRDGVRALRVLGAMSMDDPDVLRMSAEAALIVGTTDAVQAAADALAAHLEANEEAGVDMRALRIQALVQLGRASEVLEEARALARDAPGDPLAAEALGETALALRDARTAQESLERMVQAAPNNPQAHYLLGRALRLSSDAEGAERSFRRALELEPEHSDARIALGRLLLDLGRFADADALYQELARVGGIASGASTALLGRLGRVEALIGLRRFDDAQVQMESLRPQDRETANARVSGAILALAQGRPGEAVSAIRPLAEAEDARPDVIALLGDALFAAGETEPANDQYERALQMDRGLPEALLGRAQVLVRAGNGREATDLLERAGESLDQRMRPPSMRARTYTLLGRVHLDAGPRARDDARRALRRAVEIDTAPPEAWFFLGEALAGDVAPEARAAYQRYLELAPEGPYASRARRATAGR